MTIRSEGDSWQGRLVVQSITAVPAFVRCRWLVTSGDQSRMTSSRRESPIVRSTRAINRAAPPRCPPRRCRCGGGRASKRGPGERLPSAAVGTTTAYRAPAEGSFIRLRSWPYRVSTPARWRRSGPWPRRRALRPAFGIDIDESSLACHGPAVPLEPVDISHDDSILVAAHVEDGSANRPVPRSAYGTASSFGVHRPRVPQARSRLGSMGGCVAVTGFVSRFGARSCLGCGGQRPASAPRGPGRAAVPSRPAGGVCRHRPGRPVAQDASGRRGQRMIRR